MGVMKFRAACAESPVDGRLLWVVVDESYGLHHEACLFAASLRDMGRSFNTEKAYSIRTALLLTWCSARGLDWKQITLLDLARFLRWLVDEPLPPRSPRVAAPPRFRLEKSANQVMTGAFEFLRFCSRNEWVDAELVARLTETKYLNWLPPGKDAGEDGQFRTVRTKILKLPEPVEEAVEYLTPEEADQLFGGCGGSPRESDMGVAWLSPGCLWGARRALTKRLREHTGGAMRYPVCPNSCPHRQLGHALWQRSDRPDRRRRQRESFAWLGGSWHGVHHFAR